MKFVLFYSFLVLQLSSCVNYGDVYYKEVLLDISNVDTKNIYKHEVVEDESIYGSYFPCYDVLFHKVCYGEDTLWEASGDERCRTAFSRSMGNSFLVTLYIWHYRGKSELKYYLKRDGKVWENVEIANDPSAGKALEDGISESNSESPMKGVEPDVSGSIDGNGKSEGGGNVGLFDDTNIQDVKASFDLTTIKESLQEPSAELDYFHIGCPLHDLSSSVKNVSLVKSDSLEALSALEEDTPETDPKVEAEI